MSQVKKFTISFKEKVLDIVKKIPKGKVMTYKEVSSRAGVAGAARAVGSIMKKNTNLNIPCHRVIKSDRTIGNYNGLRENSKGQATKKPLLEKEGIKFLKNKII